MANNSDNILNDNFVDEVYKALIKIEPFSTLSYEDLSRLKNVIWMYIDQLYNKKFIKSMDVVTNNFKNYIDTTLKRNITAEYDDKLKEYSRQLSNDVMKYINDYCTAEEKTKFEIPNTLSQRDKDNILDYIKRVLDRAPANISQKYFDKAINMVQDTSKENSLIDKINKYNIKGNF